jgi:hypothetical protein
MTEELEQLLKNLKLRRMLERTRITRIVKNVGYGGVRPPGRLCWAPSSAAVEIEAPSGGRL